MTQTFKDTCNESPAGVRTDPDKSTMLRWLAVWIHSDLKRLRPFEVCESFLCFLFLCVCVKVSDKGFRGTSICDPPPGASLHQAGPRQRCSTPTAVSRSRPGAARSGLQNQNQVRNLDYFFHYYICCSDNAGCFICVLSLESLTERWYVFCPVGGRVSSS